MIINMLMSSDDMIIIEQLQWESWSLRYCDIITIRDSTTAMQIWMFATTPHNIHSKYECSQFMSGSTKAIACLEIFNTILHST